MLWQARSRQTSTVAPVLALSPTQVKIGLIDVAIDVDSGAMSRGAVRGDPGVGGVGVGVGVEVVGVGVEVDVDVGSLESDRDAGVSGVV
jgi:hypothetical protein